MPDEVRRAARELIDAAVAWADQDFGDVGELEADAALADAVVSFRRAVELAGMSPRDASSLLG